MNGETEAGSGSTTPPTILDRLLAGQATERDVAQLITAEVYAGLEPFCRIPAGYLHCRLGWIGVDIDELGERELSALLAQPPGEIINPHPPHRQAIKLFQMMVDGNPLVTERRDPLRPTVGVYLSGPPGVGKTHAMAAYGLLARAALDRKLAGLEKLLADFVTASYKKYLNAQAKWTRPGEDHKRYVIGAGGMKEELSPTEQFLVELNELKERLARYPYKPTDLLYLGFDSLLELYRDQANRAAAIAAIETAELVFIDDINAREDTERLEVAQHVIERRYENGKRATFITTNLDPSKLGGKDEMVTARLLSRCAEGFVRINFDGCTDWRIQVKAKRIKLIEQEIERLIAEEDAALMTEEGPPSEEADGDAESHG